MAGWRSDNMWVSVSEVNLLWAQLVLGWVTMSGFDCQGRHFISVCNQPPRSTQPFTLSGMVKWVPGKWQWCCAAGGKGGYGFFAGKTVCCHIWALWKMHLVLKGALQMSRFTLLLLYFTVYTYNVLSMCSSYGRILFLKNNFVYLDGTKLIHNCLNCTLLLLLFICMKFLLGEYLISLTWIRSPNLVILVHYSPMTFSFFYLQCISGDRLQVVKVIWQKAALPPHVDGAVVLNRWRQCAPDVIHVFYVFLCHPSQQPRISSGMPGHDHSSKNCPFA